MSVSVREMEDKDQSDWDAFVSEHPSGTFCHRAGWKHVIEKGARQKCQYLMAEEQGRLVGILPLSIRDSVLFGKALISNMFAVYGGPLAVSDDAYRALDQAAWSFAEEQDIDAMEYRTQVARHRSDENWHIDETTAATFQKVLKTSEEELLLDIPRKQRAVVRKSLKNGLTCDWSPDVNGFYALYAESVRNLGTPVFPRKIFSQFVSVFSDDVEIQVIRTPEGRPVASLMSFYHGDWVLPYYAGGTPDARKYGAHDFMYYQLMIRAADKGKSRFDFGRSKMDTGPYKFKKNWGFEAKPLQYETCLAAGAAKPDLNPSSKKFELMVKVWKKLPLPVANLLGPPLARHLG